MWIYAAAALPRAYHYDMRQEKKGSIFLRFRKFLSENWKKQRVWFIMEAALKKGGQAMEIRVRRAEERDLDRIEELYGRAGDAEEGRMDGSRWKRGVYPLRQDAREGLEAGALYVAELDGQIAGSAILLREQGSAYRNVPWQIPFDVPVFVVHTLVVDPAYRRLGVGQALLSHAAAVGRKQGIRAIRLDVYEENYTAIGFYEICGYRRCGRIDLGLEEIYGLKWYYAYEKLL